MNNYQTFKKAITDEAEELIKMSTRLKPEEINKISVIFKNLKKNNSTLVISGIGKSALIGKKISATFASLGLRSIFLHPTEALHGDLGLTSSRDAAILISKSGATQELLELVNYLPMPKKNIIGLLGNISSPLAENCGAILDCGIEREVCMTNLAPTTSTTATLSMGDALAVLFQKVTNFTPREFAINHPSGYLGKSLLLKVSKIMVLEKFCPTISPDSTFQDAIIKMTEKPIGVCIVLDKTKLKGIIVEGDIRRALANKKFNPNQKVKEIMNTKPITIDQEILVNHALAMMEKNGKQISQLIVCENQKFIGVLRIQDIIKEGFKISK
ncbi:MAG: KpsF/GutQ family sugar-phosphate isomerase [Bacteriovoracaceae bacterium]